MRSSPALENGSDVTFGGLRTAQQANPLHDALRSGIAFAVTVPEGGNLASMRGALQHGEVLTLSPYARGDALRTGDVVYVRWLGGNFLLHLVGDVVDGRVQIVNSSGGVNGWIEESDVLAVATHRTPPPARPGVPEMLAELDRTIDTIIDARRPGNDCRASLRRLAAEYRCSASYVGADRWSEAARHDLWSFDQHLWYVLRRAKDACSPGSVLAPETVVHIGTERLGLIAEALLLSAWPDRVDPNSWY